MLLFLELLQLFLQLCLEHLEVSLMVISPFSLGLEA